MAEAFSPNRKALFWGILVLLVVVVPLAVAEIAVRAVGVRVSDDPYMQFGPVQPFFNKVTIDGVEYYQAADRKLYRERKIMFPVKPEPGTFRVFCLGGSASASWPHPSDEFYSSYLEEALQRAYPNRKIEVINASAHSYSTYRVRMIFQEILDFNPNLIVIYSADNEFHEPRTYTIGKHWYDPLATLLNRSHVYRILRGNPLARRLFPENTLPAGRVAFSRGTGADVKERKLRKDPAQFERVKEHYAFSMESMVKAAGERGIDVILVIDPVNLRDWHPNFSHQELEGEELARWQDHFTKGQAALLRNDADTAVNELKLAADLNPLHGETHFLLGRALELQGQFAASIKELSVARDLDYYPSRGYSVFNATMRGVASRYGNAKIADAEAAFLAASAPRAPGFELFLDYVHPNKRGNLIVAKTVFDTIVDNKLVDGADAVAGFTHEDKPFHCQRKERLFVRAGGCPPEGAPYDDATDLPMQVLLLRLAMSMDQDEIVAARATQLSQAPGFDTLDEWSKSFIKDAAATYPPLVELRQKQTLGESVDAEMKTALASLDQFKRKYFKRYGKDKKKAEKKTKRKAEKVKSKEGRDAGS
jgi:hypothetical protein